MDSHTVHSYDEELRTISKSILEMGRLVGEMLRLAESALRDTSTHLVDTAKTTDKKINTLDEQVERQAIRVLALRQPMAIDLRLVSSALKIAVTMERMGDLAKNTVKRAAKTKEAISEETLQGITQMVSHISVMLEETMQAFKAQDGEKAQKAVLRDLEVDDIYDVLMRNLEHEMVASPERIPSIMQIIFAVKNIERIGDYVTKTAKLTYYIVSGERAAKASGKDKQVQQG